MLDPTTGWRLAANVTPTQPLGGGQTFVIAQIAGATYFDLARVGWSALLIIGLFQRVNTMERALAASNVESSRRV